MSNSVLTYDRIASAAVAILDNNLVMAKQVYRGLESDFNEKVNGYEPGDTVSMRRPADFTVREGAVSVNQDVVEGKVSLTVDTQIGIDFGFTSKDLTLSITDFSERIIKPAMVQLANKVDQKVMELYKFVPNYVGTPGQTINSFSDFAKAPERLDELAVDPDRAAVLSPADHWALLGSQTGLYIQDAAKDAYRKGSLGKIGGVDTYMSQNVLTHTTGSDVGGTINASITKSTVSYVNVKDSMTQTITTSSVALNPGDVIEIEDVYAVNPVTKAPLPFKKQFTVISYSSNSAVIYPAMIWEGPFQNVAVTSGVTDLNGKAISSPQTANGQYRQNMVFNKNAFALAIVPLVAPPGAVDVTRKTYKGTSVRVIPTYDGVNDRSNLRLDLLMGVKAIDPRQAVRFNGTAS